MKNRAKGVLSIWVKRLFCTLLVASLAACVGAPKNSAVAVYDLGPGVVGELPANRLPALPTLALADVQAPSALDNPAVLYRLAYSDPQQLHPYAQARWSMPPAQLLRQRVRETLGQHRAVLNTTDGMLLPPGTLVLRLELEEFSHVFEEPTRSAGVLRLRATLTQPVHAGEALLAQRSFLVRHPSASADASGGVRALGGAVDSLVQQLDQWVQQTQAGLPPALPVPPR